MPTLGTVAMSKNRDSDTPAARTGNTTADKPSRHAAPPTRPNDPAAMASSTNTNMPPDQSQHHLGHPQAAPACAAAGRAPPTVTRCTGAAPTVRAVQGCSWGGGKQSWNDHIQRRKPADNEGVYL